MNEMSAGGVVYDVCVCVCVCVEHEVIMIYHRVGDLAMFNLLLNFFVSSFFFLLGTEAFSKGLLAASVTSACNA
jgi:hypothetical protein